MDTNDLEDGSVTFWYSGASCDIVLGDGTFSKTYQDITPRTHRLMFDTDLYTAMADRAIADDETLTWGTDLDITSNWDDTNSILTFTTDTDGHAIEFGTSGDSLNMDFRIYVGDGVGFLIDEGLLTLTIAGLDIHLNESSNKDTDINTGTSSGATTIGNATAGGGVTTHSIADSTFQVTSPGAGIDLLLTQS
ncbi:unnamed protein product, partial [marine sediment metagenome]